MGHASCQVDEFVFDSAIAHETVCWSTRLASNLYDRLVARQGPLSILASCFPPHVVTTPCQALYDPKLAALMKPVGKATKPAAKSKQNRQKPAADSDDDDEGQQASASAASGSGGAGKARGSTATDALANFKQQLQAIAKNGVAKEEDAD